MNIDKILSIVIPPHNMEKYLRRCLDSLIVSDKGMIQLLSPIILIIGISNCLGSHYYTPAGLRKQSARYIIVGACVNLILNLLLIPTYGAIGAVFGSLMAELTISALYLLNCSGYMTLWQILKNGWKKVLAALPMYCVVAFVSKSIEDSTIAIISASALGAIVYGAGLLLLRDQFVIAGESFAKDKFYEIFHR